MRRHTPFLALAAFFAPLVASAHEVYVLSSAQITEALGIAPFDMVAVALANKTARIIWALLAKGGFYRKPQAAPAPA